MKDQKKAGVMISYFNTVLNMCISVFFTPFLIASLGDAEYGLYRVIQSFAGQFAIMTFGMSTLVSRNIVYFNELKKKEEKENFLAMALIISFVLVAILLVIGGTMYGYIDNIFANSFTEAEIITAKKLFVLFILNVAATIMNDYFAGIVRGYEKFVISNGIRTLNRILRIIILIVLLKLGCKSVSIIATDLGLTLMMLVINILFGIVRMGERVKYHYLDKEMLKTSLIFSGAIFLQAIINQVNQNLDNFILGVMVDTKTVTMYSIALTIYTTYNGITTTVSSVFAPHATRMIVKGATSDDLTNLVSRTGRYQFMLAGAVIGGFILFGQNFIKIWVGEEYLPAYAVALILIIPMTIPLIQSVTNSILDAMLKRMGRSVILVLIALIHIGVSIILIKVFGYIGAAFGTAISTIVGHIIIMNIYFKKAINLNVFKMFYDIFKGLLPSAVVSTVLAIPLSMCLPDTFIMFIVKIVGFMIIYSLITYIFGMNTSEKDLVKGILNKLKRSKNNVH